MAIGRISGSVLKSNLTRNGTDLAFETNLLYLDVTNSRIGIGTSEPTTALHVSGTITTSAISGLTSLAVDTVTIADNTITTNASNADLVLDPSGTGRVVIKNELVTNSISSDDSTAIQINDGLNVSGNIDAQGNFTSVGIDDNASSTAITIDSSQNVGIGTSSPGAKLHVADNIKGDGNFSLGTLPSGASSSSYRQVQIANANFSDSGGNNSATFWHQNGYIGSGNNSYAVTSGTGASHASRLGMTSGVLTYSNAYPVTADTQISWSERFRIASNGNVGIGTISPGTTLDVEKNSDVVAHFNRTTDDGDVVAFQQAGDKVGAVTSLASGTCRFNGGGTVTATGIEFASLSWNPARNYVSADDTIDLGTSGDRFDDIYATNSTIQTSDANEKQSIQSLTTSEMNVAKRLSPLFKTFKWNSAVEEKGDSARTHTGIIAQDVQQAFADEGLDASNYALFISTTWWEEEVQIKNGNDEMVTDIVKYFDQAEAPSNAIQKNRLGIRFPELMAFIQAYNDQRFTELEARITALENA